jgi:AcrR family transcriptional regulator
MWYLLPLPSGEEVPMPDNKRGSDALANRREAILMAAGQVFLEHGFERATTLEIATRAKTSKRELYELFGTKQDLLAALIGAVSRRMQTPLDLPAPRTRDAFFAILQDFGAKFLAELLQPARVGLYRLAIAEAQKSSAIARELDANGRAPVVAAVKRLFQQGAESGYIEDADISPMMRVFFGVLIGDLQTQMLLGLATPPTTKAVRERAAFAVSVTKRLARHSSG